MADATERRTSDPPAPSPAEVRREHQMTRLLAMSFDAAASPSITLRALTEQEERENPYGWGLAWYPDQTPCALVVKDPTSIGENAMTKLLREWERFESTIFLCHLRGAARTIQEQDTHPFARSHGGRDWVFAHNGDIFARLEEALPLGEQPMFEPVGRTDSEHVLCWLLTKVRSVKARRLADVGWEVLHGWFRELDALGTSNFLLSDGTDLVCYHDEERYNGLCFTRLVPPHTAKLETSDIVVDLGDAGDRNRSVVVVSTVPLGGATWAEMRGGQMIVVRRGALVWDSHADAAAKKRMVLPVGAPRPVPPPAPPSAPVRMPLPSRPNAEQSPARAAATTTPPTPRPSVAPSRASAGAAAALIADPAPHRRPGTRLLSITHDTVYRYSAPVERSTHLYRLRPVHDRDQEVLAHELAISAEDLRRDYEDVFGNATTRTEVERPYAEMRITSRSVVRLAPTVGEDLASPVRRFSIPLVWMPWQRQMMLPYLLPPELPETQLHELYAYAMSFVERQDHDLVQTLFDINTTIYRDFQYKSGSTTLETTPFDVYCERKGVCQDFANLFICLARLLSIPARYRVGYIYTGAGYENQVQSEASHAWVELYLPWRGWVGFDPTNGCLAGLDHVRIACGRNYRDATPTSGTIYKGGGFETLAVDVKVVEL
jgi:transglutaminase-like putative cysteine protease/predicted glutamine amidotransferase